MRTSIPLLAVVLSLVSAAYTTPVVPGYNPAAPPGTVANPFVRAQASSFFILQPSYSPSSSTRHARHDEFMSKVKILLNGKKVRRAMGISELETVEIGPLPREGKRYPKLDGSSSRIEIHIKGAPDGPPECPCVFNVDIRTPTRDPTLRTGVSESSSDESENQHCTTFHPVTGYHCLHPPPHLQIEAL
ncbi:hypothetical protein BDP27DRAFT_1423200 [Rhodocollybia butyracea]|uniref:Uncharacterized protein n=1 Tax=Rhodocollybia butyracea TaxID=206335 RepID=A0A9P5PKC1_9AGAR|nr:hypothetical protein BDP27DRAFT_1423200 [Rhodocollybia butyracea]